LAEPLSFVKRRIQAEIDQLKKILNVPVEVSDPSLSHFPLEITITLLKTPGPYLKDGKISTRYTHRLKLILEADYPYRKPTVHWLTPIFHPNIMPPHEGGYICTKILKVWTSNSTLTTFVQAIITLLANPNPYDPLGNDACLMSAQYFAKHPYKPPSIIPKEEEQ
jgi:ubiquitin-protein ligase